MGSKGKIQRHFPPCLADARAALKALRLNRTGARENPVQRGDLVWIVDAVLGPKLHGHTATAKTLHFVEQALEALEDGKWTLVE